jgi:arginase
MLGTSRHVHRLFSIAPLKVEAFKYAVRNVSSKRSCSLISVPISLGQPHIGADYSPARLKEAGLIKLVKGLNWNVNEIPDIVAAENINTNSASTKTLTSTKAKNIAQVGHTSENVYKTVLKEAKTDDFVLILGGDHCIPIGTITGLKEARPNMGVVWVDAHADLNTPESSNSGNMHGMPLGFLMGLVENVQRYPSMDWFKPCLNPSEIVYIGLRDLDEFEKVMIKKLGIKAYTMYDVDRIGIGRVMAEIEEYFKEKQHIHLSYDIDALDPVFAPHTGTAVTGGLTFREGNFICEYLYNTGKMTSMELVEININLAQHLDPKTTIDMSLTILGSTMGKSIL